jgi:hypothetical protein
MCAYQDLDGEVVVVQPSMQMLHLLNGAGSFLWQIFRDGATISDAVDRMLEAYDVDRDTAERDVQEFVHKLVEQGLAEVKTDA